MSWALDMLCICLLCYLSSYAGSLYLVRCMKIPVTRLAWEKQFLLANGMLLVLAFSVFVEHQGQGCHRVWKS